MADALELTNRVGWVTADLLRRWRWPDAPLGLKYAESLLRRGVDRGWLFPRPIRGRPAAYVLTKYGAGEVLDGRPGTGWGRHRRGLPWAPPACYDHDTRAAGFLLWARRHYADAGQPAPVYFDHELRVMNGSILKHADGLAVVPGQSGHPLPLWVEVEGARKTGIHLTRLVGEIIDRAGGAGAQVRVGPEVFETPRHTALVLPPDTYRDRRGYRVDHLPPLLAAIRRKLDHDRDTRDVRLLVYREQAGGGFTATVETA